MEERDELELESFLKRTAEKAEQRRSETRQKRERARKKRRRDEMAKERMYAPWRHYLREWRTERGLSLRDLSLKTGVSKEMISRYETYQRGLSIDVQYRLIAALDIKPSQFFYPPNSDIAQLIEAAETSGPEVREKMLSAIREIQSKL